MAIYQFLIFVLPRKSIERIYGKIPKQLEIKDFEWANYDTELNDRLEFEEMLSIKLWKGVHIDIVELSKKIDEIITRASWDNGTIWKSEAAVFDHDLSIDFNEQNNYIEDFRFRIDLTDLTMIFLKSILDLCDKNDWILMDNKGKLSEPKIRSYRELIKNSNAERFIRNPDEFFRSLDKEDKT